MASRHRGEAVIAGIGQTAAGKLPGRDPVSLNVEACRAALADARIDKDLVDAVLVKYPTSGFRPMFGQTISEALGLQPRISGVWDQAGATNISLIAYAAMAIEYGQCEIALVTMADNPRTGSRQAYDRAWDADAAVHGWFGAAPGYAMIAQRHMQQYGTTHEQLGAVAVACRKNALTNPAAQLREPLDFNDYANSPLVADPLRKADCALVSDGGAAVVVMSRAKSRELGVPDPVTIAGFGQGTTAWDVVQRPDLTTTAARQSAATAFAMAGIGPRHIDVAQIYDCFTITVLTTLEDYGFCRSGEGGKFVEHGAIERDGDLPVNTSGGLLAETGMPGMQLVCEGVRQARGTSVNQVDDVRHSLVSNQGGIMHTHSTLILEAS